MHAPIPEASERIAAAIVDAAFRVHVSLGPGLLESVYEICLSHELGKRGIGYERQVSLPVVYDNIKIDAGLRLDLVVDNCVIVEIKAVQEHHPIFDAQLLTYMKLTGIRLGLLINFNVLKIKDGIKRLVR